MNFKTYEEALAAVKEDGWALKCVPDDMKTEEMCLVAVKQFGSTLQYVPDDMKTVAKDSLL